MKRKLRNLTICEIYEGTRTKEEANEHICMELLKKGISKLKKNNSLKIYNQIGRANELFILI